MIGTHTTELKNGIEWAYNSMDESERISAPMAVVCLTLAFVAETAGYVGFETVATVTGLASLCAFVAATTVLLFYN